MKKMKFKLLQGIQAYLIWYIYNDCQIRLETLMDLDKNLQLVISEDGDVFAYRYDHPSDMKGMVKDDGKWKLTKEGIKQNFNDRLRLKLLCRDYVTN